MKNRLYYPIFKENFVKFDKSAINEFEKRLSETGKDYTSPEAEEILHEMSFDSRYAKKETLVEKLWIDSKLRKISRNIDRKSNIIVG